jgi:ABC-type multidrug transport system ATPase subunit
MKGGSMTIIVIAHRLSTIRDANVICVFNKGEIVERGSHYELLEMNGVYKALVNRRLAGLESSSTKVHGEEDYPTKNEEEFNGGRGESF